MKGRALPFLSFLVGSGEPEVRKWFAWWQLRFIARASLGEVREAGGCLIQLAVGSWQLPVVSRQYAEQALSRWV